jgi:predicted metal-dependent hydrolase
MKQELLEINNYKYNVKIYIEKRKTSFCSIRKNINIRLPLFLSKNKQKLEIERMKLWASTQIQKKPPIKEIIKKYKSEDTITIGKKTYVLLIKIKDKKNCSAILNKNQIILEISSSLNIKERNASISKLIYKVIAKEQLPFLEKKINELNSLYFKVPLGKIKFKNQNTKWGSCSTRNNINISIRLLFAPESVFEYVCIHELAHIKEPSHSNKFWKLISSIDPAYKDKHKWLKENGAALII